jgi:chitodextrinase
LDVGLVSSTTYRYRVRARDAAGNVSQNWSPIASATTQADAQAPSAPTNVTASVPSGTQVNLSWTASTDEGGSGLAGYKIERCTVANCTDYSQVGTTAVANYSDTGRTASTTYRYRLRAYDNAGNHSTYAGDITVTTPVDATAPTDPSGLAANVVASTRIDLTWTASTDSGGSNLAGYRIERCQGANCSNFAQIATSATNSYSNTGLSAVTTYQYRVRAYDGAGNNSAAYSNTVNATTLADTIPPSVPSTFQATPTSSTQINVAIGASTDEGGAGIAGYEVERCQGSGCANFTAYMTTPAPGVYANSNLPPSTTFVYRVRAFDAATPANRSGWLTATATTSADTQPPTTPATMTVTSVSSTQLNISWAASTEQGGSSLAGYELDRCEGAGCTSFARVTTIAPTTTSYSDTTLRANTVYVYRVRAYDNASSVNYSAFATASGTTRVDTQGPTVPTNLAGSVASSSQINLSWTASSDQGGSTVAGYQIWRCLGAGCSNFALVGTAATNRFEDKGLTDARTYVYRVRAYDTVVPANYSLDSTSVSVAVPDMTPPTAPDVRLVSVTASTARLSWGDPAVTDAQRRGAPATDNVGVARYEYQIGSGGWVNLGNQLSVVLSGLAVNTTYAINVRARDAAGNAGQAGATQVVTIDDVPPSAPSGLRAENVTTYSARVRWNAASDNVGVTGYRYTLNGLPPQEIGVTDFVDFGGMAQGQTYTFRIEARDQRGNWGPAASFSFTTLSLSGSLNDASLTCIASIGQTTYQYRVYRLSANGPSHDGGCYNYQDPGNLGAWKVPAAQVATYQVRATSDCPASNMFGSPLGVWTTLGNSQLWWQVYADGFEVSVSCGVRIEVRDPTDPSAILDDATISYFIFQGQ